MTDKVQKIREEVEMVVNRRLNLLNGDQFDLNKEVDGFTNEIIDIINPLQEEPKIPQVFDENYWERLGEEPVSKEIGDYDHKAVMEALHPGLKEELVSEDLFEASAEYAAIGEILANGKEMIDFQKQKAFIAGAEWKKTKLPKWKNKPLGGGCRLSGEIFVDPIRRLYRYGNYIINADKLFKLLDKED